MKRILVLTFAAAAFTATAALFLGSANALHRDISKEVGRISVKEDAGEVKPSGSVVEYCLENQGQLRKDKEIEEIGKMNRSFPTYGSREDRAVKPSAILFSYNGAIDSRLKVKSPEMGKERSPECILVPFSDAP